MKTEPNESGARAEYFAQLNSEFDKFYAGRLPETKERILSISFDRVQELERRVEELETTLQDVAATRSFFLRGMPSLIQVREMIETLNRVESTLKTKK